MIKNKKERKAMSNEFEVDDFYNYTIKELEYLKEEFIGRCDSAIGFKKSTDDIKNCKSLKEWLNKWEYATDDDLAYIMADEHFNKRVK